MADTSKKILIADDEEDLTWSISRSLRKENQGYEILCVNSGDAALKMLERHSFDLLISDIRMPGRDGFSLLNFVRKQYPRMKVIVMSAWHRDEIQKIVKNDSMMHYIEKPFDINDLKAMIAKALNGKVDNYETRLVNLSLKEIVRRNCQKKFNGSIRVTNGQEQGTIYFKAGQVIHVAIGSLEGENALRNMLNWSRFDYDTALLDQPSTTTIHAGWKVLAENNDSNGSTS